jgi:hypothetical protein
MVTIFFTRVPVLQKAYMFFTTFTNDLNFTTENFDSYGNLSFDPCEFTLHTAANAENNDCRILN